VAYAYTVQAMSQAGKRVGTVAAASVTVDKGDAVTVDWQGDPLLEDEKVTGFVVFRNGEEIGKVEGRKKTFKDSDKKERKVRYFVAAAVDAAGNEQDISNCANLAFFRVLYSSVLKKKGAVPAAEAGAPPAAEAGAPPAAEAGAPPAAEAAAAPAPEAAATGSEETAE
jgi:hypothetical protein